MSWASSQVLAKDGETITFSLACKKPRLCEAFSRAFRGPFTKGGYAPSIGEYHGGVLFHFYDGKVTSAKRDCATIDAGKAASKKRVICYPSL
jgi:hypothetical protein